MLEVDEADLPKPLTDTLIRAMYTGLLEKTASENMASQIYLEARSQGQWIVTASREQGTKTGWREVLTTMVKKAVPQVQAQSCGGYVECGQTRTERHCSDGSAICYELGKECGPGNAYTCVDGSGCLGYGCPYCGYADPSVACGLLGSQGACLGAACSLPPPACNYQSCTWGTGGGGGGGGCTWYAWSEGPCQDGCPWTQRLNQRGDSCGSLRYPSLLPLTLIKTKHQSPFIPAGSQGCLPFIHSMGMRILTYSPSSAS
jgi:hypothetical protein